MLKEVVLSIADKLKRNELIRFGEVSSALNEPKSITADVKRLNSEVGWKPNYDLDRGLIQTINWWKKHVPIKQSIKHKES